MTNVDGDRVVALAWDPTAVHPALMRRCTAILRCGDESRYPRRVLRSPADLVAATVRVLAAAGVRDHGVDVAATRLVVGLHRGGCRDPLWVVRTVVADPRRNNARGSDPDSQTGETEEDAHAGAEAEAEDDAGPEFAMQEDPDLPASAPGNEDSDTDHDLSDERETPENPEFERLTSPTGQESPTADTGEHEDAGEPGVETDTTAHQIPSTVAGEGAGTEPSRAPNRGSGNGPGGTVHSPIVSRSDAVEQGLDGSSEGSDVDVLKALCMTTSRRTREAKSHLRGGRGARSPSPEHGPIVRVVPLERARGRIAVIPTLHRAAWRRALNARGGTQTRGLTREDLRGAIRRRRGGNHTAIVVDGSSSLGRGGLLRAGAAANQAVAAIASRRGVVSVIIAAGQQARVVVERSPILARTRHALATAQTGGGTPLPDALRLAIDVLAEDELPRRRVLLLSDGRPTVGLNGTFLPQAAATEELSQVLEDVMRCVPDVALLPVGSGSSQDEAPFVAAGVRIIRPRRQHG